MKNLILLVAMLPSYTFATELVIVEGISKSEECKIPPANLQVLARTDAQQKLADPSKYQMVSTWNEKVYGRFGDYDPETCYLATAKAKASFVKKDEINQDWFVETKAVGTDSYKNPKSDAENWSFTLEKATEEAKFYCGKETEPQLLPNTIENVKEDFNIADGYLRLNIYKTKAKFKCSKAMAYSPSFEFPFLNL